MSVQYNRESPGKFDSRTLNRETLDLRTKLSLIIIIAVINITIMITVSSLLLLGLLSTF